MEKYEKTENSNIKTPDVAKYNGKSSKSRTMVNNMPTPSSNNRTSKTPNARPKKNHEEEPRFTPLLSKKSLAIAENLESPMDRLLNATRKVPKSAISNEIMKDLTFTPKINNKSKELDRRMNPSSGKRERFNRLHRIAGDTQEKLNKLRYEKENQIQADEIECLFHPE